MADFMDEPEEVSANDSRDWVLLCLECGRGEFKDGKCAYCGSEHIEIMADNRTGRPAVIQGGRPRSPRRRCRNCFRVLADHDRPGEDGKRRCLSTLGPGAGHGYWDPF